MADPVSVEGLAEVLVVEAGEDTWELKRSLRNLATKAQHIEPLSRACLPLPAGKI